MPRISRGKLRRGLQHLRHIEWLLQKYVYPETLGRRNEDRILRILREYLASARHRPPWILGVERGTPEQDAEGVDLVVTADIDADRRPLFLQIKSSETRKHLFEENGRRKFRQGARLPIIRVVVVHPRRSDAEVLRDALRAIRDLRETVRGHGSSYVERRETG